MSKENILLVEGKNDKHVIMQICMRERISIDFRIALPKQNDEIEDESTGGYEQLKARLPIDIRIRGNSNSLGVIIDADESKNTKGFNIRWLEISNILRSEGYQNLPRQFENGLILPPTDLLPKFGLWIMPNNQSDGKLEDFLKLLIPTEDSLYGEVDFILNKLETSTPPKQRYREVDKSKAFMHTWLAWQENPGLPYGVAIKAATLTTNSNICTRFVAWLNALFNP